jgi:hypothetical protein
MRANWLAQMPKAKSKPKPAVLKGWPPESLHKKWALTV